MWVVISLHSSEVTYMKIKYLKLKFSLEVTLESVTHAQQKEASYELKHMGFGDHESFLCDTMMVGGFLDFYSCQNSRYSKISVANPFCQL